MKSKLILKEGIKFGKWTVVSNSPNTINDKNHWFCECECGNHAQVLTSNLMNGLSTQCIECARKEAGKKKRKNAGDISGDLWSQIKTRAEKKGYNIEITINDAWDLFESQNKKCFYCGIELQFFGYDNNKKQRTAELTMIDPDKGYVLDNLRWVHKDIAKMKRNDPHGKFLSNIKKIYKYYVQ